MRHLQPAPERDRQHREPFRHHLRQDIGALRPAGNQNAKDAVFLQQRIGSGTQRQDGIPNGVADMVGLSSVLLLQPLGLGIGSGDCVHAPRHQPIDPPQNGILLVHGRRDLFRKGGRQRRECRIAAKADHGRRLERTIQFTRHRAAAPHLTRRPRPTERTACQPTGRKDMGLHAIEQAGKTHAALVTDQRNPMAPAHQLFRQRSGRNHVPSGPAGGEHKMPSAAHAALPQRAT